MSIRTRRLLAAQALRFARLYVLAFAVAIQTYHGPITFAALWALVIPAAETAVRQVWPTVSLYELRLVEQVLERRTAHLEAMTTVANAVTSMQLRPPGGLGPPDV